MDGSFVNSVPRKDVFFLVFAGCALAEMPKERAEGDLEAEVWEDEGVKTGKPGDRGPPSISEAEVMIVDVVAAVFVVRAVPVVLVECLDPANR